MKKRIKNLVVLLLTFALSVSALTGCGKESGADTKVSNADKQSKTVKEDKELERKDPITGEEYPNEIRIGLLNGSLIDSVAKLEGFYDDFKEETGVTASTYFFESGRDVNNAYASDSVDVATFGSSPISLGTTNNLGYDVIYLNDTIGEIEALAVTKDIKSSEDLKGKTVAAPFASTSHYSLLNYLKSNGLEKDVNVIDLQPQDILAAWERGDIDGAYVWAPVLGELKKNGNILIDSAKLADQGILTADLSTANHEFAEKYPTLVTAFVDIQNKVNEIIINNKDKAIEEIAKNLNISSEEAEENIDGSIWLSLNDQIDSKFLGTSDAKGSLADTLKSTADFHVTQDNLEKALDLKGYQDKVNPSFAEALLNN